MRDFSPLLLWSSRPVSSTSSIYVAYCVVLQNSSHQQSKVPLSYSRPQVCSPKIYIGSGTNATDSVSSVMAWMIGTDGLATTLSTMDSAPTSSCTDLLQLVLLLLWTCLNVTPQKQQNPIFAKVFSSQAIIEELLSSTSIVFDPGLFAILQAATPPAVSYFKTLLTTFQKRWAVYLLLLEKPSCHRRSTLVQEPSSGWCFLTSSSVRFRYTGT